MDGLSPQLVKNMRYLATIRNKLVHEYDFNQIPERATFIAKFDQSTVDLKKAVEERGNAGGCVIC